MTLVASEFGRDLDEDGNIALSESQMAHFTLTHDECEDDTLRNASSAEGIQKYLKSTLQRAPSALTAMEIRFRLATVSSSQQTQHSK